MASESINPLVMSRFDRIRSGFDELNDIVQTTKANALFNRLGDELKALASRQAIHRD